MKAALFATEQLALQFNNDERGKLARIGRHCDMMHGETVMSEGDENVACATLVSGALKIAN